MKTLFKNATIIDGTGKASITATYLLMKVKLFKSAIFAPTLRTKLLMHLGKLFALVLLIHTLTLIYRCY